MAACPILEATASTCPPLPSCCAEPQAGDLPGKRRLGGRPALGFAGGAEGRRSSLGLPAWLGSSAPRLEAERLCWGCGYVSVPLDATLAGPSSSLAYEAVTSDPETSPRQPGGQLGRGSCDSRPPPPPAWRSHPAPLGPAARGVLSRTPNRRASPSVSLISSLATVPSYLIWN